MIRCQRLIAETKPLHDAGREVLDQDIGRRNEVARDLPPGGARQVERDAAFVAVGPEERTALARDLRMERPHVVAARRRVLDLDHVSAKIREDHGAERSGNEMTEVDDAHSVECAHPSGGPVLHLPPPTARFLVNCPSVSPNHLWLAGGEGRNHGCDEVSAMAMRLRANWRNRGRAK